jgi:hypothetical protein
MILDAGALFGRIMQPTPEERAGKKHEDNRPEKM